MSAPERYPPSLDSVERRLVGDAHGEAGRTETAASWELPMLLRCRRRGSM